MNSLRILVALVALSPAAALAEESAVTCLEGVVSEPIRASFGSHTVDCAVDETTDGDQFTFTGNQGDLVWLLADGMSGDLDVQIKLYSGTTEVASGQCAAYSWQTCTAFLGYELESSGLHTVVVSDWGKDNAGLYTLQIERVSPNQTALVVEYDDAQASAVDPTTDLDFYRFPVKKGTRIQVALDGFSGDLDAEVRVYNGAGEEIGLHHCAAYSWQTCSTAGEYEITEDDTFTAFVRDWGGDNAGDYGFSVNCLVGVCPTAADSTRSTIEMPGKAMSGVNGVSGWKCPQYGALTVSFDGGSPIELVGNLPRLDTAATCGNGGNNGFLIPYNYARLGSGRHTAVFRDAGVRFAKVEFSVETLGGQMEPFARGLQREVQVHDFPRPGETTTLEWSQSLQGFILTNRR